MSPGPRKPLWTFTVMIRRKRQQFHVWRSVPSEYEVWEVSSMDFGSFCAPLELRDPQVI